MKSNDKITWLKGYLESLYLSENVTKEHIKLLISKFEELSEEVEIMESLINDEKPINKDSSNKTSSPTNSSTDPIYTSDNGPDDLPF